MPFFVGALALLLGAGEFLLDVPLFRGAVRGDYVRALLFLLPKLGLYALGFTLLFLLARENVVPAAVGYGAGFFPALLITAILLLRKNRREDASSSESNGR